jgi:hypothetical protein
MERPCDSSWSSDNTVASFSLVPRFDGSDPNSVVFGGIVIDERK